MAKVEVTGTVERVLSRGVLKVIEKHVSRDGREFKTWFTVFPAGQPDVHVGDAVSVTGFVAAKCGGLRLQNDNPILNERDGQPERWVELLVNQATVSLVGTPGASQEPRGRDNFGDVGSYPAAAGYGSEVPF